ncbi:DUF3800 domain-containing protein [Bythopirellula goksoeyrii]|uniref:DUF3800 domain-containing protein n=1 Tax=Bythopirellula goksoeyrii TaxID=1400387 RepID=A0A5B9QBH6_9BACT|nr:DUF3800 domain-containing protein [Bythopirellula goksoeyrii]QEG34862.1 hypothetical protein Pr1d_21500 [Bythopirellula goksoeyrii]
MKIEVYCDESRPDLFASQSTKYQYMVLGSLWIPSAAREAFKQELKEIKQTHDIGGEAKWQKVSHPKMAFYRDIIDWFFSKDTAVRFRSIVIDREKVDRVKFHDSDCELAFYKFYYQLLHHWIYDFNTYSVFCDFKSNRSRTRLSDLQKCLDHSNLFSDIARVQPVRSIESVLIQLSDILTGLVSSKVNRSAKQAGAKSELIDYFESRLGNQISHTPASEEKFNVFVINLQGGW